MDHDFSEGTFSRQEARYINLFETHYDAAILGGGLCGIGAALTLANAGKKVILIEQRPMLGWEVTAAFKCNVELTPSPTVRLVHRTINAIRGLLKDCVDAPLVEIVLDQMMEQYGIDVLLYSLPTDLQINDRKVTGVVIGNKSGEQIIHADLFVDATDNAILWKLTGIEWYAGDPPLLCQSFFFNPVVNPIELPLVLGNLAENILDVTLFPSVRPHEVRVEYKIPTWSIRQARLTFPQAIQMVRDRVPQVSSAAVTHDSIEPMPMGVAEVLAKPSLQHPLFPNLFAAGLWGLGLAEERASGAQPAGRIEMGENTSNLILSVGTLATQPKVEIPSSETEKIHRREISELPVYETDILVVGGGTGGCIAGIEGGRQKTKTTILEASTFLGGMKTGSGQNYVGHGIGGGVQDEFHSRVWKMMPIYAGTCTLQSLHPETGRVILDQMSAEANTEIVYGATSIGVEMDGQQIKGVIAATPIGKVLYRAKIVIDSTGDADVARMAGAPLLIGRDYDSVIHCYSQVCHLLLSGGHPQQTNWDSGYVDPWDIIDLTRARRQGVRQVGERFFPTNEGERPLLNICPLLGLRGGPLIVGDAVPDMIEGILPVEFPDCVGYSGAKYDCHSQDYENQLDLPILWVWMLGNRERHMGGQMPYRMMLPKNVEGLLVACRGASSTPEHNYQFRTMRNQHHLGEAAAIAAAQCIQRGINPRQVDVKLVQDELHNHGALGDAVKPPAVVKEQSLVECKQSLFSNDPKDAVWLMANGGEPARRVLKEVLQTGSAGARFWASVALAWMHDDAALPELIAAIENRMAERADYTPRSRNMVPLWQSCIVMLGRIGNPAAVPVLLELLQDPLANIDVLIASIRALGRINDSRAVPAILKLLEKPNLPRERKFQMTSPNGRWPVREDALWQLELAAAEILAGLGAPQPHLVEKYLNSGHNQTRRYARKVKALTDNVAIPAAFQVPPGC